MAKKVQNLNYDDHHDDHHDDQSDDHHDDRHYYETLSLYDVQFLSPAALVVSATPTTPTTPTTLTNCNLREAIYNVLAIAIKSGALKDDLLNWNIEVAQDYNDSFNIRARHLQITACTVGHALLQVANAWYATIMFDVPNLRIVAMPTLIYDLPEMRNLPQGFVKFTY